MKDRWSVFPFTLGAAVLLILSFVVPTSPYFGALGIWMGTVAGVFGKGLVFFRVAWDPLAALPSLAGLIGLTVPWLWLKAPSSRKWRWILAGGFVLLTGLQFRLLAGNALHPRFLDPWLIAYLAAAVLTGVALVGLGHGLAGKGATKWLLMGSGTCITCLFLLPFGVLLLAIAYLWAGRDPDLWSQATSR